jgi:hypothetical protein
MKWRATRQQHKARERAACEREERIRKALLLLPEMEALYRHPAYDV